MLCSVLAVSSVHSSQRLEKEKDELRVALEEAVQQLQEQHQRDLAELEQRLQAFYQAEWDKVHLSYQEEADRCKAVTQQQVGSHPPGEPVPALYKQPHCQISLL